MEKNASEIGKIIGDQLDTVLTGAYDKDAIERAKVVANLVGKSLKLSALEIRYAEARKVACPKVAGLERDE